MRDTDERSVAKSPETQEFDTGKVARTLHAAMESLLEKEISASSINAACNCAQQITNILRLHLEANRLKAKMKNMGL